MFSYLELLVCITLLLMALQICAAQCRRGASTARARLARLFCLCREQHYGAGAGTVRAGQHGAYSPRGGILPAPRGGLRTFFCVHCCAALSLLPRPFAVREEAVLCGAVLCCAVLCG